MEVTRIANLFKELRDYLSAYADDSVSVPYNYLCGFVEALESDSGCPEERIARAYKALYPGRGGLSDFYIWDDDYQKRRLLNEPLERTHKELWNLLKNYV